MKTLLTVILLLMLATACGGGGGASTTPPVNGEGTIARAFAKISGDYTWTALDVPKSFPQGPYGGAVVLLTSDRIRVSVGNRVVTEFEASEVDLRGAGEILWYAVHYEGSYVYILDANNDGTLTFKRYFPAHAIVTTEWLEFMGVRQ